MPPINLFSADCRLCLPPFVHYPKYWPPLIIHAWVQTGQPIIVFSLRVVRKNVPNPSCWEVSPGVALIIPPVALRSSTSNPGVVLQQEGSIRWNLDGSITGGPFLAGCIFSRRLPVKKSAFARQAGMQLAGTAALSKLLACNHYVSEIRNRRNPHCSDIGPDDKWPSSISVLEGSSSFETIKALGQCQPIF